MFLKNLTIENSREGKTVRSIKFRKGINLIVDNTNPKDKQVSGNNVGKTTVLRLIDFCLGGDGKNIYRDREFKEKGANTVVENFLKDNDIVINLVLKENLEDEHSREIRLRKNFLSRTEKIQEIDGEQYNNDKEFVTELNRLIFKTERKKPTFRQLISKNIRDEKDRLQYTVKVLHQTTNAVEYEALFLFWLGIETESAGRKQLLSAQLKKEREYRRRLSKEGGLSRIRQTLIVLNRRIEELEKEKGRFGTNINYDEDLQQLNAVKKQINELSTKNSQMETRKNLITESIAELEKEEAHIDIERIKALYEEAKILIPNLQKTFEETLTFHNQMLNEKREFMLQELPEIEHQLEENNRTWAELASKEQLLSEGLQKKGLMEELEIIVKKLRDADKEKARYEALQAQWENSQEKINEYENELEKINEGIDSLAELVQSRTAKFNDYFSEISSELYDEYFILSCDKNEKTGAYELSIDPVIGNPGTGKKKGEIMAFDLAYIQFADAMDIECLHFVLHDQIETVHDNQISTLLTNIVERVNVQLVLPVLNDKLPSDIDTEQYTILELSQSSKLFGV